MAMMKVVTSGTVMIVRYATISVGVRIVLSQGTALSYVGNVAGGEENPSFTHQEWKECLIYFRGSCAYCGSTPRKTQRLTRDHLEPLSNGGRTIQANIVPACSACNSSKGGRRMATMVYETTIFFTR